MIDALKLRMDHITERQKLIASNIANANTPEAKTLELEPFSLDKTRKRLTLERTDKTHMSGKNTTKFLPFAPRTSFVKLDGNDISLQNESLKLSENNLAHQQIVDIYNKLLSFQKIASQSERK